MDRLESAGQQWSHVTGDKVVDLRGGSHDEGSAGHRYPRPLIWSWISFPAAHSKHKFVHNCAWVSQCVHTFVLVFKSRLAGPTFSVLMTPPTVMFRSPPPPPPACSIGLVPVCGSSNRCKFIRLHINVVSIEPTPALLVALIVYLPVVAVTVEVEQSRWLRSPQQFYCCARYHFNISGSVYSVQALFVCTVIKILWMSWITMERNTECVCVFNIGIFCPVVSAGPSLLIIWNRKIWSHAASECRRQKPSTFLYFSPNCVLKKSYQIKHLSILKGYI